jgi:hypothetical protein
VFELRDLGAIRRIALGPIVFEEEITAFESPTRWVLRTTLFVDC